MFSLFRKKDKPVPVNDVVFASNDDKANALLQLARTQPATLFICWFDQSQTDLENLFAQHNISANIVHWRQVNHSVTEDASSIVFIEHYPLSDKEQTLFKSLGKPITVFSSLEEPLLMHFGGDRIKRLLTTLGMSPGEAVSHPMIADSIRRAQGRLAENMQMEQTAQSMEEWMRKNAAK